MDKLVCLVALLREWQKGELHSIKKYDSLYMTTLPYCALGFALRESKHMSRTVEVFIISKK
jgi:hypothetical protein